MQTDRYVSVLIEEAMHHEDHQEVSVSRGYSLPSRWAYMLQEYGACSGTFRLPAEGCTTIVEVPIDWSTVEALPALFERREASAVPPHERQVARVIPQQPPPEPGRPLLGRGTLMLLNQLLQQEPGLPGRPHRHRRVSPTRSSVGTMTTTMLPRVVVLRAASAATAELAFTRKVINAHRNLTCVYYLYDCVCCILIATCCICLVWD